MANLASLRALTYVYLGTPVNDPYYPPSSITALVNEAYQERVFDVRQANPNYLVSSATLTPLDPTSRTYIVPADFGRYLDVRITDKDGKPLREFASEDANGSSGADGFTLTGVDEAATLTTLSGVEATASLYLLYAPRAAQLVNDNDTPDLIPGDFHTLLAMDAAFVAYALGGEQVVPPAFLRIIQDKEARFWSSLSQRGIQPTLTREGVSQTWPG